MRVDPHVGDRANSVRDQKLREFSRRPAAVADGVELHRAPGDGENFTVPELAELVKDGPIILSVCPRRRNGDPPTMIVAFGFDCHWCLYPKQAAPRATIVHAASLSAPRSTALFCAGLGGAPKHATAGGCSPTSRCAMAASTGATTTLPGTRPTLQHCKRLAGLVEVNLVARRSHRPMRLSAREGQAVSFFKVAFSNFD